MNEAVVIHPRFTIYGGGEVIALHVIKALQDAGYRVSIVTDNYNPAEVEKNFRMGRVMEKCLPIKIPPFKPVLSRFLAVQRLLYATRVLEKIKDLRPDVSFSTQSVIYYTPKVRTFHIVYDMTDLFEWPSSNFAAGPLASPWKKPYYRIIQKVAWRELPKANRRFVPLSRALEIQLARYGYPHTPVVFSPCDMIFRPGSKRKRVVLVSRIAPQKNITEFMRIAALVPEYSFVLVAAHTDASPAYVKEIRHLKPENVQYIEARIRDRPELVEESKVYLYTSLEPGIGIALGQAMGAGCIPVTPAWGGGAEMVRVSGVGAVFRTIEEAAQKIRFVIESEDPRYRSDHVAERAKIFSSENFESRIRSLAQASSL